MKAKTKIIISSLAVIAVCVCMIVGVTFALFTSTDEFNIAVTAGKVKVTATLGEVKAFSLGEEQDGGEWENGGKAEADNGTLTLDRMTAGDSAEVKVKISNESDIKIKYRVVLSVQGELASVLETRIGDDVYKKGSAVCGEWVYASPISGEDKTAETVTVSVSLPLREMEYDGASANIVVRVEAVQANGNIVTPADIDEVKAVIESAENGETVTLGTGEYDFGGSTINANRVRIVGTGATIKNTTFEVANDGKATFESVSFVGKTALHAQQNTALEFKHCTFDVAPDKLFGNSRAAAILGSNQHNVVDLVLDGCTFNYAAGVDKYSPAIFMWSSVKTAEIKNCSFNGYGFVAVKFMNVAEGANILFEGNTFNMSKQGDDNWYYNTAVQICPQHDNTFAVTFKDNVFTGDYETQDEAIGDGNMALVFAEVIGMNAAFSLTKATVILENNTFNGAPSAAENVAFQSDSEIIVK